MTEMVDDRWFAASLANYVNDPELKPGLLTRFTSFGGVSTPVEFVLETGQLDALLETGRDYYGTFDFYSRATYERPVEEEDFEIFLDWLPFLTALNPLATLSVTRRMLDGLGFKTRADYNNYASQTSAEVMPYGRTGDSIGMMSIWWPAIYAGVFADTSKRPNFFDFYKAYTFTDAPSEAFQRLARAQKPGQKLISEIIYGDASMYEAKKLLVQISECLVDFDFTEISEEFV